MSVRKKKSLAPPGSREPRIAPIELLKFLRRLYRDLIIVEDILDSVPNELGMDAALKINDILEDVGDQLFFLQAELKKASAKTRPRA